MAKKIFHAGSTIGEVIKANPENADILMGFGMHCFSCPMSQMESLEEACSAHETDLDLLLEKLNK